ncbi:MAG: hypothetical protein M1833_001744 [Piccolia ochrophora]|nr:MAG: hypothetical protein M1833_001744 [Piccolia ochrophora]
MDLYKMQNFRKFASLLVPFVTGVVDEIRPSAIENAGQIPLSVAAEPHFDDDLGPRKKEAKTAFADSLALTSSINNDNTAFDATPGTKAYNLFNKYFENTQEARDHVQIVFNNIIKRGQGSFFFEKLYIQRTEPDRKQDCVADGEGANSPIAYLSMSNPHQGAIMVMCDKVWKYKALGDITCKEVGDEVSGRMATLGSTFLHEFTHWFPLVEGYNFPGIIDFDEPGYGPVNTVSFNRDHPRDTLRNADSYRWFAIEHYWALKCRPKATDAAFLPATDNSERACQDCRVKEKCCCIM